MDMSQNMISDNNNFWVELVLEKHSCADIADIEYCADIADIEWIIETGVHLSLSYDLWLEKQQQQKQEQNSVELDATLA